MKTLKTQLGQLIGECIVEINREFIKKHLEKDLLRLYKKNPDWPGYVMALYGCNLIIRNNKGKLTHKWKRSDEDIC